MPAITKKKDIAIVIKNADLQLITGVIYSPDVIDSQDDFAKADAILKAAHKYMAESRVVKTMHEGRAQAVDMVESFIAPVDYSLENGSLVKKGSWVGVLKVNDPAIWARVKSGELTGLSMGGQAKRVER